MEWNEDLMLVYKLNINKAWSGVILNIIYSVTTWIGRKLSSGNEENINKLCK